MKLSENEIPQSNKKTWLTPELELISSDEVLSGSTSGPEGGFPFTNGYVS